MGAPANLVAASSVGEDSDPRTRGEDELNLALERCSLHNFGDSRFKSPSSTFSLVFRNLNQGLQW
jgi:hypothetical protein